MKAIETTATLKNGNQLLLDKPLQEQENAKVRLLIFLPDNNDINEQEWGNAAMTNSAFEFLNDPGEDIYSENDGKPFENKG